MEGSAELDAYSSSAAQQTYDGGIDDVWRQTSKSQTSLKSRGYSLIGSGNEVKTLQGFNS